MSVKAGANRYIIKVIFDRLVIYNPHLGGLFALCGGGCLQGKMEIATKQFTWPTYCLQRGASI